MSSAARWEERKERAVARGLDDSRGRGIRSIDRENHIPGVDEKMPSEGPPSQERSVGASGLSGVLWSRSWSHSQGPFGLMGQKPSGWVHSWWGGAS
jgi:hypothetical protein